MEYKASKDMTVNIITIGVIALFTFIGYKSIMGLIASKGNLTPILIYSGTLLFLAGTLIGCYLFAPRKYLLNEAELVIVRPISNKVILLDSITDVRQVNKEELKGTIRTFGVGGLFGNYGKFFNPTLGSYNMYGTQSKNFVLLILGSKKIIITPNDSNIINQIKLHKSNPKPTR